MDNFQKDKESPDGVRCRFAPSPTGYLHVGGARTALFNWLFARANKGSFVLRVEDTDQERNTPEARQAIFDSLRWLGLDWDEGPLESGKVLGDYGPYFQSKRQPVYEKWFEKLESTGRVYEDQGAWRLRFERKPMIVNDMICGKVEIDYRDESNTPDMVIRRSDGTFVFHFVNVIDDMEMGITHVIRGEDHLMNTPKHIQLLEALGAQPPQYAHIPLILNKDGSKMGKRDKGAAVRGYMDEGYLPDAVVNFLALLGWSPKDDTEIFSKEKLIDIFKLSGVNRSPAKFDEEKCKWINQQYLMGLEDEHLANLSKSFVSAAGLKEKANYVEMVSSIKEKVQLLSEVPEAIRFMAEKDYVFDPEALEKLKNQAGTCDLLEKLAERFSSLKNENNWEDAKASISNVAKENGAKPGQLMFATRVALSGKTQGPDLGEMLNILGAEEVIQRIRKTTSLI